jgi:hypothetical protein
MFLNYFHIVLRLSHHFRLGVIFQIGMVVLLYAWNGPESPVAKATILSIDPDTVVGGDPLGSATYEVVNVVIRRDATLPYQYDDLCYIGDVVTRSIAWPSRKVFTIPVCFLHTTRFVLCVMLNCDNFARRGPTSQGRQRHLAAEVFLVNFENYLAVPC